MNEEHLTDELLRNFILGKVDESQREQIEDSFLVDPEIRERVLIVEQELSEDYLEGNLASEDQERFLARSAQTSDQRQQLEIARSIKKYAVQPGAFSGAIPQSSFVQQLKLRPVFLALATVAIVVLVGSVWLMTRWGRGLEGELVRLNGSTSEVPKQTLRLKPVVMRGEGEQVGVRREAGVVELRLTWLQSQRHQRYRARLRHVGDDQWFATPFLQPHNDDGYFISVKIPANLLQRGMYQLELSGINSDGSEAPAIEYVFEVTTAETERKD